MQKFAGEGLRTLVLAERYLDEDFFAEWRTRQQEAALSIDGREDKLGAIYEEIECDMDLVGVTAIEDKLQDGVPQTIANLQMAGIKIWVLTGDKQVKTIGGYQFRSAIQVFCFPPAGDSGQYWILVPIVN